MKRHPALRDFSDDHHQGLVQARRLRRATDTEAAACDFLAFWLADTKLHFRREEEDLLPALALCGMDLEHEPFTRMLSQHARLRGLVRRLDGKLERGEPVEKEELEKIGTLLEEHIRLEERVVFPLIETNLTEEDLRTLGETVARNGGP